MLIDHKRLCKLMSPFSMLLSKWVFGRPEKLEDRPPCECDLPSEKLGGAPEPFLSMLILGLLLCRNRCVQEYRTSQGLRYNSLDVMLCPQSSLL